MSSRVFVIAEIASAHDGDRAKMSEAIQVAKGAGADAIKFQWTSSPERLAARRHAEGYLWAYRAIAFPQKWLAELEAEANAVGIEWICTTYLPEDIPIIAPLVKRFKVASFESSDEVFLDNHLLYGKPMIVSTGGMDEATLWKLKWWANQMPDGVDVSLLHCVSAYPTPMEELNLHAMDDLDGLSDHTANVLTGALAAIRGASIIEVHFCLETTSLNSPDWRHSLLPTSLRNYMVNVRLAEAALGDGFKRVMPSEKRWAKYRVKV